MSSASNSGQKDFLANSEMVKGIENSLFSAAHVNGIMLETMLNYNKEVFDFLQCRLGQDLKTAQKFTCCENLSDLGEECTEFCGRAIEDYSAEIAKLANMGFGLANQALGRLQEEAVVTSAQQNGSGSAVKTPVKQKTNGTTKNMDVTQHAAM